MNRTLAWTGLLCLITILATVSLCRPELLSDQGNAFLKGFVNEHLLALLGVVLAITLASAGNLHLELNKLQEATGKPFAATRRSVKLSAYSLIVLFGLAVALVILKPILIANPGSTGSAAANSLAIVLVVFNLSVLLDLTQAVFKIPAMPSD